MTLDISVLIPHNSAVLVIEATDATEQNCARHSRRLRAISQHTNSYRHVPCFGSTDNMAPGRCLQMWPTSPL